MQAAHLQDGLQLVHLVDALRIPLNGYAAGGGAAGKEKEALLLQVLLQVEPQMSQEPHAEPHLGVNLEAAGWPEELQVPVGEAVLCGRGYNSCTHNNANKLRWQQAFRGKRNRRHPETPSIPALHTRRTAALPFPGGWLAG